MRIKRMSLDLKLEMEFDIVSAFAILML
jgi:hypothetical protein